MFLLYVTFFPSCRKEIDKEFTLPFLLAFRKEINEAKKKKMPYDFAYLLLISKVYKLEKKKKKGAETELWGNPEEEVIAEVRVQVSFLPNLT